MSDDLFARTRVHGTRCATRGDVQPAGRCRAEGRGDARARVGAWRHGDKRGAGRGARARVRRRPSSQRRSSRICATLPDVAEAEAAGPGFVNIRLRPSVARDAAGDPRAPASVRRQPRWERAQGQRGIRFREPDRADAYWPLPWRGRGDALANLLGKAGYDVTKEYYINDAGAQVTALAWAAYWRYLQAIGTPLDRGDIRRRSAGRAAIWRRLPGPGRGTLAAEYGRRSRRPISASRHPIRGSTRCATSPSAAMMQRDPRRISRLLGVTQDCVRLRARVGARAARSMRRSSGLTAAGWSTRACWSRRRARRRTIGSRASNRCSAPRNSATTWIGRCANATARTLTLPTTSPITPIRSQRGFRRADRCVGRDHGGYVSRMKAAVQAVSGDSGARGGAVPDRACAARRPAGAHVEARRHLRDAARPDRGGRARTRCGSPC